MFASATHPTGRERVTTTTPAVILAFICIAQFMVFIDVSIVNLALPSIQDGLAMSDVSLNYVVTAYATVLGGFSCWAGDWLTRSGGAASCRSDSSSSPWHRSLRDSHKAASC